MNKIQQDSIDLEKEVTGGKLNSDTLLELAGLLVDNSNTIKANVLIDMGITLRIEDQTKLIRL